MVFKQKYNLMLNNQIQIISKFIFNLLITVQLLKLFQFNYSTKCCLQALQLSWSNKILSRSFSATVTMPHSLCENDFKTLNCEFISINGTNFIYLQWLAKDWHILCKLKTSSKRALKFKLFRFISHLLSFKILGFNLFIGRNISN